MNVIVQHGVGDCAELLRLTGRRHFKYAVSHGHKFIQDYGRRCPERPLYWEKIPLLIETLRSMQDGELLAYLDADTLIVDPKTDLFDGFSADIGMTTVNNGPRPPHFNTGVILIKNSSKTRALFDDAYSRYPNEVPAKQFPKWDEKAINDALADAADLDVAVLHPRMNSWPNNAASKPVVAAWHGTPNGTVRKRITAELASA